MSVAVHQLARFAEKVTTRNIVAIAAFSVALTCIFSANLIQYAMIGKINQRLPANEQVGYLGFYWSKNRRIRREYRRLYPDSRLDTINKAIVATAFTSMAVCAWAIGIFR